MGIEEGGEDRALYWTIVGCAVTAFLCVGTRWTPGWVDGMAIMATVVLLVIAGEREHVRREARRLGPVRFLRLIPAGDAPAIGEEITVARQRYRVTEVHETNATPDEEMASVWGRPIR